MRFAQFGSFACIVYSCIASFDHSMAGTFSILQNAGNSNTAGTVATGIVDINDTLFVSYEYEGAYQHGTIVSIPLSIGSPTVLYDFMDRQDGAQPVGLVAADNGHAYGVTYTGGTGPNGHGAGTIFKVFPRYKTVSRSVNFPPKSPLSHGGTPIYVNGALYGNSQRGSAQELYKFDLTTHVFKAIPFPISSAISFGAQEDGDGELVSIGNVIYGLTGGEYSVLLFRFDTATEQFTTVPIDYSLTFKTTDGQNTLYGISGQGVVSVDVATGEHSTISSSFDNYFNIRTLVWASGQLYGTESHSGTLFQIDLSTNTKTDLHSFGMNSTLRNLVYHDKALYGTYGPPVDYHMNYPEQVYRYVP